MPEKLPFGYWDVDDSTNDANIEAVLYHIEHYTDIPTEAINALRRAFSERDARIADLVRRQDEQSTPGRDVVSVKMPAARRRAYIRDVSLVEYTRVCRHCGRSEVITVYPTAKPTVCERVDCKEAEKVRIRQLSTERQRRHRNSKKTAGKSFDVTFS